MIMKIENWGTAALHALLVLSLMVFAFGAPAHASNMALIEPLPSLDSMVDRPTAVTVDGQGRVYVAESLNNRVRIFAKGGTVLTSLTGLAKPVSVAVDGAGRIYVGNALKGNVTVFDTGRHELFKLGTGDGEFGEPADIDIDSAGQVYVVDKDKHAIRVYDASGRFVRTIGVQGNGDGQLSHPTSLAIDRVTSELVVLDHKQIVDTYSGALIDGARLQFFSTAGAFLRGYAKFGYNLTMGQLVKPIAVAVDGASRIYVTDARQQKVMVYDNTNTFLGMIDNSTAPLRTPLGLSISANGRLYVSSLLAGRVNVFGIDDYSAMEVQPATLDFMTTAGGDAPAPQIATIMNSGRADLIWMASTTDPWLSLSPKAGTLQPAAFEPIAVGIQPDGLASGTYNGSVKVAAQGIEERVSVTLTVKPNPLQVSPAGLSFVTTAGITPAGQSLTIVNGGETPLHWSASANQDWLILSKTIGGAPETLRVYANTTDLTAGSYSGTITFNNPDGQCVRIAVSLSIGESTAPPSGPHGLPLPDGGVVIAGGMNWLVSQPKPGVTLRGVWGNSRRDVLAVGDGGTILGYGGKVWTALTSGTDSALRGIWGRAAKDAYDVYTVGDGGMVLHFDGAVWSAVNSNATETLEDVCGTGSDVLAAGAYGSIFNLSQASARTGNIALRGIWGSSATDVFAVGETGTVLHSDGTVWTAMTSDTSQWLNAVWGSSATDVFAVGENGTIVHYDGLAWTAMESGVSENLHGVYGDAPDNVYAVGDNAVLLHYDGAKWSVFLAGGISLRAVWTADQMVVVVGDDGTILTGKAIGNRPDRSKPPVIFDGVQQEQTGVTDSTDMVLQTPQLKGPTN